MSNKIIDNLFYTKTDEWLKVDNDLGIVGISDYAQDQLGDIVYLEEIEIGKKINQGAVLTTIESVKAVSDMNSPVSGEVVEVNQKVFEDNSIINQDPYGKGWIVKIKITNNEEIKSLMSAQEYSEYRKE